MSCKDFEEGYVKLKLEFILKKKYAFKWIVSKNNSVSAKIVFKIFCLDRLGVIVSVELIFLLHLQPAKFKLIE